MNDVMVIDRAAVQRLRSAWAAGRPPADPWARADPRHETAWAYAPRKVHPDFIPTRPTTRAAIARVMAARGVRS